MGLVKFNNTTLSVEGLPDGAVVITGEQLAGYQQVQNAYTMLKSKLPIGVSEDQLASLTEKGQRFDQTFQELAQTKTQFGELKTQIDGFKNIPKDFTIEKWNQLTSKEQQEIRSGKLTELTKQVADKLQKEAPDRTLPKIDNRFLPQDKVKAFDPDAQGAVDQWAQILGEGFQAQQEFAKTLQKENVPSPILGGGPQPTPGNNDNNGDMPSVPHL